MKKVHLPNDSRRYTERAFLEKEKWHRRRERMSLTRKIEVLDRLLLLARDLPRLESNDDATRKEPDSLSDPVRLHPHPILPPPRGKG